MFTCGRGGPELRPFSASAEVVCRGYSPALQRAMTDFGADEPFAGAAAKLREHYGIAVPVGVVRAITEQHGAAMVARQPHGSPWPETPGAPRLITEMDGSMVPRVDTAAAGAADAPRDRRKPRQLSWTEARLCLVREPGSVTPRFGGTMGSVAAAGDQLWECAVAAGVGRQTRIHGVGDGAPWIADQVERTLGAQATYLIDFYPLCDDVAAAPVRACVRYLANRTGPLDYQQALAADLPIGSGEIESAHRYILQSRLKRAGSWWTAGNLANMLALRVLRANREWDAYWTRFNQQAA